MSDSPQLTWLGKLVLAVFIAGCVYNAYRLFVRPAHVPGADHAAEASGLLGRLSGKGPGVEIGVAYGTEKKRWLEWAAAEFARTDAGARIKVELIPMGSLEAAQAILGVIARSTCGRRPAPSTRMSSCRSGPSSTQAIRSPARRRWP